MTHLVLPARSRRAPRRVRGFTLAELLITVVIIGVATAIGLPMMQDFVDDSAASAQAEQVLSALNYTRSEAVKRNTRVTMCHSSDGATCSGQTGDWHTGWLVFVDDDPSGVVGTFQGTDKLLRVQRALPGKALLKGTGGVEDFVSYTSGGQARTAAGASQTGALFSCQPSKKATRRVIALTAGTGWVGVAKRAAADDCTT